MFSAEFKQSRTAQDPKWFSKLILRAIQVFVAFIGVAVGSAGAKVHIRGSPSLVAPYIFYLIFWILTFAWSFVNFSRLSKKPQPIHPGAVVAVELIAWLGYLIASSLGLSAFTLSLLVRSYCSAGNNERKEMESGGMNEYYKDLDCSFPNGALYMAGVIVMAFGGALIGLIHFYLFVLGCVETSRHRRNMRNARMQGMSAGYMPNMQNGPYASAPHGNYSFASQKA